MQAVQRVQAGETVREVARDLDISESAIYAQIKREQGKTRCPCCGQVVREGYKIDRSVLKSQQQATRKR
jgi:DNA-binding CsgD family transcriptional regulator